MTTVVDIEKRIEQTLRGPLRESGVLPEGYGLKVHLLRGARKKRRDADFERNWNLDTDSIRIAFEPEDETVVRGTAAPRSVIHDPLPDLVRALERAEARPGYEFISLKWFRDTALASEAFPWAADESARHDALRDAIDRRWILTSKVANPRPPHFPVTAIRLNRQMQEVNAALGVAGGSSPTFQPITMRGESLSATVLRDRR